MYLNLTPLSPQTDQDARIGTPGHWGFAARERFAPVALDEAQALAAEYVLVFSQEADGTTAPIALLGTGGANAYLDAQGQWQARTVPARMRLYPFALVPGQQAGQYIVARDADAPHFAGEEDGQALFDAQGQPSPLVQQIAAALVDTHRSQLQAQALAQQLKEAGLMAERRIDVQLKDGSWRSYAGFLAIDEERLAALDASSRNALQQSGALQLLALHRASLGNFGRLVQG